MLLGPAVGRGAVNAETNAVIGFGKIFEEVKSRAALPRLKVDLPSAANHDFFHTRMLNRSGLRPLQLSITTRRIPRTAFVSQTSSAPSSWSTENSTTWISGILFSKDVL
jgi:hypothetical protein